MDLRYRSFSRQEALDVRVFIAINGWNVLNDWNYLNLPQEGLVHLPH